MDEVSGLLPMIFVLFVRHVGVQTHPNSSATRFSSKATSSSTIHGPNNYLHAFFHYFNPAPTNPRNASVVSVIGIRSYGGFLAGYGAELEDDGQGSGDVDRKRWSKDLSEFGLGLAFRCRTLWWEGGGLVPGEDWECGGSEGRRVLVNARSGASEDVAGDDVDEFEVVTLNFKAFDSGDRATFPRVAGKRSINVNEERDAELETNPKSTDLCPCMAHVSWF